MCTSVLGARIKDEELKIFGLFTVPIICKLTLYGESCRIIGPKKIL